jgi:hypothetical protein
MTARLPAVLLFAGCVASIRIAPGSLAKLTLPVTVQTPDAQLAAAPDALGKNL